MFLAEDKIQYLKEGIEYLDYVIPKIKKREVSFVEAQSAIDFIKELYSLFDKGLPKGLDEEIEKIYGRPV